MKKTLIYLSIALLVYLAFGAFLYAKQRDLLYLPTADIQHQYPEEVFKHQGQSIKVIKLNPGQQKGLIFFGGNAESMARAVSHHINNYPQHTLYMVNYRGFGGSSGTPSEQALYDDALYIYDQIKSRHQQISVIGRSLGSGVATYLAANRNIERLLLVTPFDSVEAVAQAQYPVYPISLLLKDKFDSISRASKITAKVKVILSEFDRLVPHENSMRLIEAFASDQIEVTTIKGAKHNNLSHYNDYEQALSAFFN